MALFMPHLSTSKATNPAPARERVSRPIGPRAGLSEPPPNLAPPHPLWQGTTPSTPAARRRERCRSSVVEHSLGKGEVVSSILTGSTSLCGRRQKRDAHRLLSQTRLGSGHF